MNTCEVQDVASLRPADHICIWDTSRWPFRYTHHGIVYTSGTSADEISVAHVWSRKSGLIASQADSRFQITSLSVGWSKQVLSRTETKVPFLTTSAKSTQALERLELQLQGIREVAKEKNRKMEDLIGKRVYLRLKDSGKFAKRFGDELYLVQDDPSEKDWAFRQRPTSLRLGVRVSAYNCVRVEFEDYEKPGDILYASSSGLKLTRRRAMQFKRWFQFELGWDGELQSLRHRRWFVGAQTRDGLLRPFISRDKAATFEIIDADEMDAQSPVIECSSSDSEENEFPAAPVIKRAESAPVFGDMDGEEDGNLS
ncbi:Hypothetical protein PHPALM_36907 [Phytophthora palmivora]|uniref:Uncharacterized protein n=1 Tax=Phytophthora palmivora TaxID=4796 RepID=A0A2P4WYR8_9STRA|nr:Hypothetical protein PHPALM_36907 [Phytophthora palmivora]